MSTRCSIAYAGPLHIYAESNDNWAICITKLEGSTNEYNGDITMTHEELREVYVLLKDYFEKYNATYERYAKS